MKTHTRKIEKNLVYKEKFFLVKPEGLKHKMLTDKSNLSDEEEEQALNQTKRSKSTMKYSVPITNRWGILEQNDEEEEKKNNGNKM